MKKSISIIISLLIFASSLFLPGTSALAAGNGKMLYIKSKAPKELIQRVKVEAGSEYIFTFGLSNTINDFNVVCRRDGARNNYDAGITQVSKEKDGNGTVYSYKYTVKSDFGESLLFFGIQAKGDTEGCFYNPSVIKAGDADKTELLPNPDFKNGLDEWSWGWDAWFGYWGNKGVSEWENDITSLKVLDFNAEMLRTMLHVRYKSIKMTDDVLVRKLNGIEANVKYTASFNYYFVSGKPDEAVNFVLLGDDDDPGTIRKTVLNFSGSDGSIIRKSDDGITAEYTFQLNSSVVSQYKSFYAGFYFKQNPRMITEFYIAGLTVFKSDSDKKTDIIKDKSMLDMSGWYSHWLAAKPGSRMFGATDAAYLEYTSQYVSYDPSIIEPEYDDVHCGDTNFDGVTDIRDLVRLKKYFADNACRYISSYDCNGDGRITSSDLVALSGHLIGRNVLKWDNTESSLQRAGNIRGGADREAEKLKSEIYTSEDTLAEASARTVYYVSSDGSKENSGLSPDYPMTFEKLRSADLKKGDTVLFKRGDTIRIKENYRLTAGVGYGAYGAGEKPVISGSLKDYADSGIWSTENGYLWQTRVDSAFASNIVFNGGEYVGVPKLTLNEADDDGDFYFDAENRIFYLYLRQRNPGNYFDSIEISSVETAFISSNISDVTLENLKIQYVAKHAVNLMKSEDAVISGCEFRWIGGAFTAGGERYGNAIQLWDRAVDCSISHNYIYQVFDSAITFQGNSGSEYRNLKINSNLIEYCSMNFEFWDEEDVSISGIDFSGNILRFSGYGFGGMQRTEKHNQAYILGWYAKYSEGSITDFNITGNIFDVANSYIIYASYAADLINICGNTYYQDGNCAFCVTKNENIYADSRENFAAAIKRFDKDAAVNWQTCY